MDNPILPREVRVWSTEVVYPTWIIYADGLYWVVEATAKGWENRVPWQFRTSLFEAFPPYAPILASVGFPYAERY